MNAAEPMKCAKCGKVCYAAYGTNMAGAANPISPSEMIPYCSEHAPWQASAFSLPLELEQLRSTLSSLQAKHDRLEAELTAERERRVAAEKVVDAVLDPTREWIEFPLAKEYRTIYPKGDDRG